MQVSALAADSEYVYWGEVAPAAAIGRDDAGAQRKPLTALRSAVSISSSAGLWLDFGFIKTERAA